VATGKEQGSGEKTPGPMHYPAFQRALAARAVSGLGTWMQVVAAGWLVYDVTGDAAAVGILTVASKGPGLLLSGWGGELADRYDRRRVVAVTSLIQALFAGLLVVVALGGVDDPLLIYAPVLGMGIAGSLGNPANTAIVIGTVPEDLVRRATGIFSVTYNLARLAGPAIAGAIVALADAAPCFALNAVSDLIVAALCLTLPAAAGRHSADKTPLRHAATQAFADKRLRVLLEIALVFSLIVAPIQELAPVIARSQGDGAHLLGFMLAALAAGGLLGNWLRGRLEPRTRDRWLLGGALLGAGITLAFLAVAVQQSVTIVSPAVEYVTVLLTMVMLGVAWDVLYVITLTDVQLARRGLSGAMTGLYYALTLGGLTLGAIAIGALIDVFDLETGLLICAVLLAGLSAYFLSVIVPPPDPAPEVETGAGAT